MSWFKRRNRMQAAIDRLESAGFTVSKADPGTPALRGGTVRIGAEMFALLLETQSAAFAWANPAPDAQGTGFALANAADAFEAFMDSQITRGGETRAVAH